MEALNWSSVLPPMLKSILQRLPAGTCRELEEIRIRVGRPLEIGVMDDFQLVTERGERTDNPDDAYRPSREDGYQMLDLITNHSLYTMEEELRRGFLTIPGGHRIGLAGRTVLAQGRVSHLREITGFNLRIAREVHGIAASVMPMLLDFKHAHIHHTLIVSPPQQGKTTLLRDLVRAIGSGLWHHPEARWKALKVGVVDERSEIAGCIKGVPSYDLGYRTDVLDGCPKAEGMMMFIRSMSPDVLAVDETGREEDLLAMSEAMHAGVRLIATAHAEDMDDLLRRPGLRQLLEEGAFRRIVTLRRAKREWQRKVYDEKGRVLKKPVLPMEGRGPELSSSSDRSS